MEYTTDEELYDTFKNEIMLRLYNNNVEADVYESAAPYGFDDLIIVPFMEARQVTTDMVNEWGITQSRLFEDAWENTRNQTFELRMFNGFMPIISTPSLQYGAIGAIVMADKLKEYAPDGYFILPSSIHEVIFINKNDDFSKEYFDDMVRTVTDRNVIPAERLDWHAYEFKGGDD